MGTPSTPIQPPFTTPGLPLSFLPSIPLSLNGRFGCLSGNCAVGGWKAALACEWVDMWPQRAYELVNVCLCSSLEMLCSPPHFTVFSGCKSLSATSLKLSPLNQLCLCDAKRAADRRVTHWTSDIKCVDLFFHTYIKALNCSRLCVTCDIADLFPLPKLIQYLATRTLLIATCEKGQLWKMPRLDLLTFSGISMWKKWISIINIHENVRDPDVIYYYADSAPLKSLCDIHPQCVFALQEYNITRG